MMNKSLNDIVEILGSIGPLTGKELLKETGSDDFSLWSACSRSEEIVTRIIGNRYLRLDKQVEEYARLSPSIMREFHGYTVVGTKGQLQEIDMKAKSLSREMARISKEKLSLAQRIITSLVNSHEDSEIIKRQACFLIAGDVVYGMSHAEPRPESSTGELVRGSDLDIIVVAENLPEHIMSSLDSTIYSEKYNLLVNPSSREELDYIVKDILKVEEQLEFKDFKSMVGAKILYEAEYLYGSPALYSKINRMLREKGIPEKILALEKKAQVNRKYAESYLLKAPGPLSEEEYMKLFYTAEEKEEIF